jgi:hypothetical protein
MHLLARARHSSWAAAVLLQAQRLHIMDTFLSLPKQLMLVLVICMFIL